MTKEIAKAKIESLIGIAKQHYDLGGGENEDGGLERGEVDFDELQQNISAIIDKIA